MTPILQARDVSVSFGGLKALNQMSLTIQEGDIHGLIGPNGAGKTTAINVLTGFLSYEGEVRFENRPIPKKPFQIALAGVARTFQSSSVFPDLSAGENVMCAGHRWTGANLFQSMVRSPRSARDEQALRESAQEWLSRVGFQYPFDQSVQSLPFGEQRKIEIARALMAKPRLLLLDEPTAGLTSEEVLVIAKLLRTLRNDSKHRLSILLVEHNVPFIFSVCDRVTALDKGKDIAAGRPAEVKMHPEVISSYLGTESAERTDLVSLEKAPSALKSVAHAPEILNVRNLDAGYGRVQVIRGVDLSVKAGEIIVICGRNGAGKSTLLNALVGSPRISRGQIEWLGSRIDGLTVSQIVRLGIALVPQERGVLSEQTVMENLWLATSGLGVSRREFGNRAEEMLERFPKLKDRRTQLAGSLSGGERQMLAFAKVLVRKPKLLLLDEPSIGIAPTIIEEFRDAIERINKDGIAVLVAEQNVWWLAPLATRAILIENGRFVAEGCPSEIIQRETILENFFGHEDFEDQPRGAMATSR